MIDTHNTILDIKNLSINFQTSQGKLQAIRDISLKLYKNEILAIVGESGSGKSVLCKSIMGLLPSSAEISGHIAINNHDITNINRTDFSSVRGKVCSIILQDPMSSLNPVISIGNQIIEAILIHQKMTYIEAKNKAIKLLELVGITFANERFDLKPHCFSGGMLQRCIIAIAIAQNPQILFADEPTTGLDSSTKLQILDLLSSLKNKINMSIVFISHDLGTIARIADRVAIMYAGKIIEIGTCHDIFYTPAHPYTRALLLAQPKFSQQGKYLPTLPGLPPLLINPPKGDAFAPRNKYALNIDFIKEPPFYKLSPSHQVASWLYDDNAPKNIMPPWSTIYKQGND